MESQHAFLPNPKSHVNLNLIARQEARSRI